MNVVLIRSQCVGDPGSVDREFYEPGRMSRCVDLPRPRNRESQAELIKESLLPLPA